MVVNAREEKRSESEFEIWAIALSDKTSNADRVKGDRSGRSADKEEEKLATMLYKNRAKLGIESIMEDWPIFLKKKGGTIFKNNDILRGSRTENEG